MPILPFFHQVCSGQSLPLEDAHKAMSALLQGDSSDAQIAAFLVALKMKGETAEELAGFARAMRECAVSVDVGEDVIDTCGTGGDGSGTFNISTAAAFVMAGAGAHVAKHGNRSISSRTGSADVFEALGIRAAMTPEEAGEAIRRIGLGFLFAPSFHPAMRFVQPVRRELKMRTVFNLLGPLANPAHAGFQVIGAPSAETAAMMANALALLGTQRSFVVHGEDGLDEISTTAPTQVFEIRGNAVEQTTWRPSDFGVSAASPSDLRGGEPAENARIITAILEHEAGPKRDIVLVNAAAGLLAAGLAASLHEGVAKAAESIDSGRAAAVLARLRAKFPAA